MCPRVCISLFVLQMLAAFVSCEEQGKCISFDFEIERAEYGRRKLKLDCRYDHCADFSYAKAAAIKISKVGYDGNVLLASIDKFKNLANGTSVLGSGTEVSGDMVDVLNPCLVITWSDPSKDQEGRYICEMTVKGDYDTKRTLSESVNVAIGEEDARRPGDASEIPESSEEEPCNKTQMAILREKNLALQRELAEAAGRTERLVGTFFEAPLSYISKRYFLSRRPYLDDEESDDVCNVVGGYLVEINDADEYQAVAKYIKSNNASGSLISGTDDAKEGAWVYHRSKLPVEYFNWLKGQPDNKSGRENCIVIWIDSGDFMNDVVCKANPYRYPFICEVD